MRAAEETEIRHNMEAQGLMSYNERLLEEYRNSSNEVYIVSIIIGVTVFSLFFLRMLLFSVIYPFPGGLLFAM